MKKKRLATIIIICIMFLTSCVKNDVFHDDRERFHIDDKCIDLNSNSPAIVNFPGRIWYNEDTHGSYQGESGLHWIERGNNAGIIPLDAVWMLVSPDGKKSLIRILESDYTYYEVVGDEFRNIKTKHLHDYPIWLDNSTIISTSFDIENTTISYIKTYLESGVSERKTIDGGKMFSNNPVKIGQNGLLTYIREDIFIGPTNEIPKSEIFLIVYDTNSNKEVAKYTGIFSGIRPFFYGHLLNHQGTHILSISSLAGEGYDTRQQELFGVEIGKEPVQITDFHSKYPYFLIYDLNFGGQRWSPDNQWVLLHVLPSDTGNINSITDPSYLFIVDLQKNIARQFCKQITATNHQIAWSPDSQFFTVSLHDRIWVINPKTLEAHLLIERPGIPLHILGWTTQ